MKPRWECVRNSRKDHKFFIDWNTGRLAAADQSGFLPENTDDGILWVCTDKPITLSETPDSRLYLSCRVLKERSNGEEYGMFLSLAEAEWLCRCHKMQVKIEAPELMGYFALVKDHGVKSLDS